jgi:Tol biopolymer transport system component
MIAFNYLTDLWTMNADGTNRVDIGGNGDQNLYYRWSSDASKLAFTMPRCPITSCEGGAFSEVWVINADGTNRVNITSYSAHDSMGDW